jgi:sugar/nucleoside kinase (ribokinase family)
VIDLVVVTPAYLDYTLVGLEALPGPGEETFAGDMLRSPGGGGISAVGARRLGLNVALASPLGDDLAGNYVRRVLREEGVEVGEPRGSRTPITVVLPVEGERAMVTVDPGLRARPADVVAYAPRAVTATLEQIDLIPPGPRAYVTCGDDDARAFAGRIPRADFRTCALMANRRDACILTGASDPADCARRLGEVAETAVVTLGADGALAAVDDHLIKVEGIDAGPVIDSTGAGDLFAAALAWADLLGADAEVSLQWANLYAGLSVTVHTGAGGALTRDALLAEGARRGLPELPTAAHA